jgi:hypothetical protein
VNADADADDVGNALRASGTRCALRERAARFGFAPTALRIRAYGASGSRLRRFGFAPTALRIRAYGPSDSRLRPFGFAPTALRDRAFDASEGAGSPVVDVDVVVNPDADADADDVGNALRASDSRFRRFGFALFGASPLALRIRAFGAADSR